MGFLFRKKSRSKNFPETATLKSIWNRAAKSGLTGALGKSFSAQVALKFVGFFAGLLTVRLLETEQYAHFTLASSFVGALAVLGDSGISAGALKQGGKVWRNPGKLGTIVATSLHLRKKFAGVVLAVVLPILFFLLQKHGAGTLDGIAITLAVCATFLFTLTSTIYGTVAKLAQKVGSLSKIELSVSLYKLLGLVLAGVLFPFCSVVLIIGALAQFAGNLSLKKLAVPFYTRAQAIDGQVQTETMRFVRNMMPMSVFYCINGQLVILVVTVFGSTAALAEVGALGRIMQVFSIFFAVFNMVLVPRYARLESSKKVLKRFLQVVCMAFLCGISLLAVLNAGSTQILSILGSSYANLNKELFWAGIMAFVSFNSMVCNSLGLSRGWVFSPLYLIPSLLITQVVLLLLMDLSSLSNVLIFGTLTAFVPLVLRFPFILRMAYLESRGGLRKLETAGLE